MGLYDKRLQIYGPAGAKIVNSGGTFDLWNEIGGSVDMVSNRDFGAGPMNLWWFQARIFSNSDPKPPAKVELVTATDEAFSDAFPQMCVDLPSDGYDEVTDITIPVWLPQRGEPENSFDFNPVAPDARLNPRYVSLRFSSTDASGYIVTSVWGTLHPHNQPNVYPASTES